MLTRTLAVTVLVVLASAATHARDNGQYAQVAPEIKRWVEGLTDEAVVADSGTAGAGRETVARPVPSHLPVVPAGEPNAAWSATG